MRKLVKNGACLKRAATNSKIQTKKCQLSPRELNIITKELIKLTTRCEIVKSHTYCTPKSFMYE